MPNLFVIAGCNGAGKTTLSKLLLPEYLKVKEFVNADEIARGLSPFNPEGAAFTAGRVMLERINELAEKKIDFAIETTLASKTYAHLFKSLKATGYELIIVFVFLGSPEEAIKRVRQRVKEGGHNIPVDVIRRRYTRGLKNFNDIYTSIADMWTVVDNTYSTPKFVSEMRNNKITIFEKEIWKTITKK
jgi:predicted ABC-type ATPase